MCSQSSQKLPDTCPNSASQKSQFSQSTQVNLPWGYLFPNKANLKWTALLEDTCLVGRSPKCHVILGDAIDAKIRGQFSKEHFRIRRGLLNGLNDSKVVYIDDLSFNGTYINNKKLGKGRSAVLRNNDIISLALSSYEAFIYMDQEPGIEVRWFPPEIHDVYAISRKLGSGAFGEVRLVFDKTTGQGYAMKIIQKNRLLMPDKPTSNRALLVQREISILKRLRHLFVIKFHNVLDVPDAVFLVVELVQGGELFDRVQKRALKEPEAKYFFYQLALAIKYLHRKGIIHRDIKLENILLSDDSANPMIKLADFGLSNFVDPQTMLKTFCGTPMYIAPEVLISDGQLGSYDTQADVWSMGIVLYMCLSGMSPFAADDPNLPLTKQILSGYYSFPKKQWRLVSHNAQSLVKRMLVVDPTRRITIDQILNHPWLKDQVVKTRIHRLLGYDPDWLYSCKENFIKEEEEIEDFCQKTKKARLDV